MRVTNSMLIKDMLWNANNNMVQMSNYQSQMSSGKKIQRPSDDAVGTTMVMKYKTDIREAAQYQKNIDDSLGWLEVSESALTNLKDVLQRARELTVQAANGTNTTEDRQKIQLEMEQLKQEVIAAGNATNAGRYIFTGLETNVPLFNEDGTYNVAMTEERDVNRRSVEFEVSVGTTLDIGTHPLDIFGIVKEPNPLKDINGAGVPAGDIATYTGVHSMVVQLGDARHQIEVDFDDPAIVNIASLQTAVQTAVDAKFGSGAVTVTGNVGPPESLTYGPADVVVEATVGRESELVSDMNALIESLETGNDAGIQTALGKIDVNMERLLSVMGEIGGKTNRVEFIKNRVEENEITFTGLLSKVQDVDMAEAIMYFKNLENVYRASLSVGSKVIQPSLVDFIR